jgi:hypothetical protein
MVVTVLAGRRAVVCRLKLHKMSRFKESQIVPVSCWNSKYLTFPHKKLGKAKNLQKVEAATAKQSCEDNWIQLPLQLANAQSVHKLRASNSMFPLIWPKISTCTTFCFFGFFRTRDLSWKLFICLLKLEYHLIRQTSLLHLHNTWMHIRWKGTGFYTDIWWLQEDPTPGSNQTTLLYHLRHILLSTDCGCVKVLKKTVGMFWNGYSCEPSNTIQFAYWKITGCSTTQVGLVSINVDYMLNRVYWENFCSQTLKKEVLERSQNE